MPFSARWLQIPAPADKGLSVPTIYFVEIGNGRMKAQNSREMNRKQGMAYEWKFYLWDLLDLLMGNDSIKRLDRIVAILIHLQSRRIVTAQELADRFQVSLRTIYRDIRSLEVSGVPIVSEAGVGYSIMEGYRLPPVMFSREEASSFVAAEKLMQKFSDKSLGAYHKSAMYKIKSVLRGSEKEWVETLESQVLIDPANELFNKDIPDALEILFESMAEKMQVAMHYLSLSSKNATSRNVEPVGLFHENNFWYLFGYCHLRKDYRQFRTDRIKKINRTRQEFAKAHESLDYYMKNREVAEKIKVRILVDKGVARYLGNSKNNYGFVAETDRENGVEMVFMTPWLYEGFARWYLSFGDYATILEPERLKVRVSELLEKQLAKL
jgi:predicted DNA-binding transcriptional regulator YafY